jgi:hypothetical protein
MPGRTPRVVVVNEAGSWILRVQAAILAYEVGLVELGSR